MADDQTFHDDIEGYCGALSYPVGAEVGLHVSTRSSTFDVRVERWGAEREPVWAATDVAGSSLHHRATLMPQGADGRRRCRSRSTSTGDPDSISSRSRRTTPRTAGTSRTPASSCAVRIKRAIERVHCWCWRPTRGTPTTRGAAAACTPVGSRCRSADRSAGGCCAGPRSSATTARRGRCAGARSPTWTD